MRPPLPVYAATNSGLVCASALLLFLAGCPRVEPMAERHTLHVALEGRPATLDPRYAIDAYSTRILALVVRGLTRIDRDGSPIPDLAKSWHYTSPTTLQIELLAGQSFHDGTTIDAQAVAVSLRAILDPALGSPLAAGLDNIVAIEPIGPSTLEIRLARPFAPLLSALQIPILHPAQVTAPNIAVPIGNGSFRFAASNDPDSMTLKRVRSGSPTSVSAVVFRALPDANARAFALETGASDLAQNNVAPHDLPQLTGRGLKVEQFPGWNISYLAFNTQVPALSDVRVRRAIAQAIDRDAILKSILAGTAEKTDSLIPPQSWAYVQTEPLRFDPQAARRLLLDAGYGSGGQKLELRYKTSNNPERLRIAEAIAANLRAVGIAVELQALEFGTFFDDVKSGNFDIFSLTWVGITDPDHLHYALHSHSVPPVGGNRGHWSDKKLDDILDAARTATDTSIRRVLYVEAQKKIAADLPVFPLWVHASLVVQQTRFSRFQPLPNGNYTPLAEVSIFP